MDCLLLNSVDLLYPNTKVHELTLYGKEQMTTCKYSHNGDYFVTGTNQGHILIWDVLSFTHLRTFSVSSVPVLLTIWSFDDNYIISIHEDMFFCIWSISENKILFQYKLSVLPINIYSIHSTEIKVLLCYSKQFPELFTLTSNTFETISIPSIEPSSTYFSFYAYDPQTQKSTNQFNLNSDEGNIIVANSSSVHIYNITNKIEYDPYHFDKQNFVDIFFCSNHYFIFAKRSVCYVASYDYPTNKIKIIHKCHVPKGAHIINADICCNEQYFYLYTTETVLIYEFLGQLLESSQLVIKCASMHPNRSILLMLKENGILDILYRLPRHNESYIPSMFTIIDHNEEYTETEDAFDKQYTSQQVEKNDFVIIDKDIDIVSNPLVEDCSKSNILLEPSMNVNRYVLSQITKNIS